MDFSQRLKELRVEKQMTQRELAHALCLSPNIICEWEKSRCQPGIETLKNISQIFECSIDYLVGNADDFGNVTVYQQTDNVASLTSDEQRIIDYIRKNPPHNATEWMALYAELPRYMQESIFAELKGMHLGYTVSKATKNAGESKRKA